VKCVWAVFLWVWLDVVVKNISGADLIDVTLHVFSIQKDGSRFKVQGGDGVDPRGLTVCLDIESPCASGSIFKKDSTITMRRKVWCQSDEEGQPSFKHSTKRPEELEQAIPYGASCPKYSK
jgi:hypothetical protein